MTEKQRRGLFASIKMTHLCAIDRLRQAYLHKEVTLINTWPRKSRGRAALIEAIIIRDGIPLFLCMVLRSGSGTEFLNSEGWTRQYRPWDQFVVLADE
jgi:hypothetical protein